jgi:hypothetical protein
MVSSLSSLDRSLPLETDFTQIMLHCPDLVGSATAIPQVEAGEAPVTETVLSATQQMVQVIQQLRSAEGGESADLPPTAAEWVPYLEEELHTLMEALQAHPLLPFRLETRWQHYQSLQALLSWLLWAIARSSYEVMRLIEGIPAECQNQDPEQADPWQTGVLRLVTRLDIAAPNFSHTLDLATQQAPNDRLAETVQLRAEECTLWQGAIAPAALLSQIETQVQLTTPLLSPFFEGANTVLLMPNHPRQTAVLWLQLAFEFVPVAPAELPSRASSPLVQFTEAKWQDTYRHAQIQQQWSEAIAHLPGFQDLGQFQGDRNRWAVQLVEDGERLADWMAQPIAQSSLHFLHRPLSLENFGHWILWRLSRSAYEMTQLVGGVHALLLQPGEGWKPGILRLWADLYAKTVEADWRLDLATGAERPATLEPRSIAPDSVVQLKDWAWCPAVDEVQRLQAQVIDHVQQATPEFQALIQGIGIELLSANHWEAGGLQLSLTLEFIPDGERVD